MSDPRSPRPSVAIRPRFRCLVCRVFVTGTDDGVCPRCGWRPPGGLPVVPRSAPVAVPTWVAVLAIVAAIAVGALVAVGV